MSNGKSFFLEKKSAGGNRAASPGRHGVSANRVDEVDGMDEVDKHALTAPARDLGKVMLLSSRVISPVPALYPVYPVYPSHPIYLFVTVHLSISLAASACRCHPC